METVRVCLESGLLATEACGKDVRNILRSYETQLYPEDIPTTFCDLHVMVDYCENGVAGEYCYKFASVGALNFTQKSLVRLTQERIDQLMMAKGKGLDSTYIQNNYVYLVDKYGNPQSFHGMDRRKPINLGIDAPYLVCTKHTKAAWLQYLADHPWLDDSTN